ncbi:MAG: XdhC/CoxI family protein [Solirubrobacteraceae bacterium]
MTIMAAGRDVLREWLADGRRIVAATLVETEGSSPLPPGVTMLIDEDGDLEGSITGGCIESAVAQEAAALLAGGAPQVIRYGISDELAGTVGLMCGGIVYVFVHELDDAGGALELAVLEAAAEGRRAAIATLLDGEQAGAKLALIDGTLMGTLGGPELLDHNVARDLVGELEEGRTVLRRFGVDGATMGAELRVHIRSFGLPPQMIIFGAIDFSAAIAPIARELGYEVTIADAREPFIRSQRFTEAAKVAIGWPDEVLSGVTLGPRDAVLVFTHDPKFDGPALINALATDAGYIGALGSRKTTKDRNRRLREAGVGEEQLARVHAPCGLDIGSRTPQETAVSVLAEIIAVRAARGGQPLRDTSGPLHPRDPGA